MEGGIERTVTSSLPWKISSNLIVRDGDFSEFRPPPPQGGSGLSLPFGGVSPVGGGEDRLLWWVMSSGNGSRLRGTPLEIRRRIRKGGARSTILKDWHLLRESSSRCSRDRLEIHMPRSSFRFLESRDEPGVVLSLFSPRSPSPLAVVLAGMISLPTFTYVYHKCASRAAFTYPAFLSRSRRIFFRKEISNSDPIFNTFSFCTIQSFKRTCSRYSKISFHALMSRALLQLRIGRSRDSLVWLDFSHWVSRRRVNKGKSLINLIDPRRSLYLEILESRMRPCGVVNTVGGTRTTDRHLLPERTASLAGLSGKISIVSFCVTQVSSFFLFSFLARRRNSKERRNREGKKKERGVLSRGIQIRRAVFISYFSARLIAARVSPFDKCCAFLDALYN